MADFNYIQSFTIKPDQVNQAPYVFVTSVNLYFSNRPPATGNKSGILEPGVSVYLCPFENDQPNPEIVIRNERAEALYRTISSSGDASIATQFYFETPIVIEPGKYYGLVVLFDDPDFELWSAVQDQTVLNTTTIYSGSSGEGDGKLYNASNDDTLQPLADRDIKFEVKIAKFTANTATIELVNKDYEFFTCNNMSTSSKFKGGELVFQNFGNVANATVNTFYSRAGSIAIIQSDYGAVGTNTTFTTDYSVDQYVLLTNQSNTAQQEVAKIKSIFTDTEMTFYDALSFSNTCWHTPVVVGAVHDRDYVNRTLYLTDSTASNSTVRFFENAVSYFTITNPGGSYTNGDVITVSNGTIDATAVLVTNASGNVSSIRLVTPGAGFPNASHSVLTITTSTGSGATLVPTIAAPLKGITSGATADLISIDNASADIIDPDFDVTVTSQSYANASYNISNTTYAMQSFAAIDLVNPEDVPYDGFIASRSNEVRNTTNLYNTDKSAAIRLTIGVNSGNTTDAPLYYSPYLYEDDIDVYTFENRISAVTSNTVGEVGRGNTLSKHITKKISFANNQFAEDIRVYINAYKPEDTEILVYAKVHNSADPEAYDDKSWSPLELKAGINQISARDNKEDTKEYTYGFPQYPNVEFTCAGTGTTELSNNVVRTTSDLSSNLAADDLVRVYNPLFSITNYIVTPVQSVNSTAVVLRDEIANNGLIGTAMKIDKLRFKNVAYNNVLNDNVARYYNTSMVAFDTYDSMSIKMVMLSNNRNIAPEIDDIRVIAVSA